MLAKRNRFHGNAALRWVYKGGQQARGPRMSLRFRERQDKGVLVAVVVSRKVSKSAVVRNRIRRRIYEVLRALVVLDAESVALIVTVYDETVATMPTERLTQEVRHLLSKARSVCTVPSRRDIVKREGV